MKHKHADLIHAWADGAEIEYLAYGNSILDWKPICKGWSWANGLVKAYRIKPESKKPVVRWLWANSRGSMSVNLLTENEAKTEGYTIKLEWSRTEFPK